jgi:hypothetical protein
VERGGQQAVRGDPSAVRPGVDEDSPEVECGVEPDGESRRGRNDTLPLGGGTE